MTTQTALDWLRTLDNDETNLKSDPVSLCILHTKYRPCDIKFCPIKNGVQYVFRFKNNYGASVVCHDNSYGLELALVKWDKDDNDDDFKLVYTKKFPTVIGYCNDAEIEKYLKQIKKIKTKKQKYRTYFSRK